MPSDNEDESILNPHEGDPLGREVVDASQESEAEQEAEYYGWLRRKQAAAGERRAPLQLWLVSYSDFMTILLIFFLAMYAYTHMAKVSLLKSSSQKISYQAFADIVRRLKTNLGSNLEVISGVDKVVLQLRDKILFESGHAELTPNAMRTLEELANSIKLVEGDVIVQGHTDNIPVTGGPYRSNWELSAARAFSVIAALTQAGVVPERLSAWGFGEYRPLVANDKEDNRLQNRRIEIVILKKKGTEETKSPLF
ncbi:MAG: flagellar motor protein MotB [Elusimicrobia bacterium]|nr:flagellar motor protein MotB [Candidatus Obscuribacterium magneticum]